MAICGGTNFVRYAPAFSNDGKRLLVCTDCSVTVLGVSTMSPVLKLDAHTDIVTSVCVLPGGGSGKASLNQAWTSSLDGTVRLWDFEFGNLLRTLKVDRPVVSMVIPSLLKPDRKPGLEAHGSVAFLSVSVIPEAVEDAHGSKYAGRVILLDLTRGKVFGENLHKTTYPQRLVVSPYGNFVGLVERRKLHIWGVPDGPIHQPHLIKGLVLHHTRALKVLAFDPTERTVAGGDDSGRILCWHNFGEHTFDFSSRKSSSFPPRAYHIKGGVRSEDDAEACTTDHWHANEVKCLLFSADGTYLMSGGSEGTLVLWLTETDQKQFLPRLGGQLLFMVPSSDPSVIGISCLDNTIRFINISTMSHEASCRGIQPVTPLPPVVKSLNSKRVAFDPQKGWLILATDRVTAQFYDVVHDRELFEVPIVPHMYTGSDDKRDKGLSGPSTFVTHITFSVDRSVMATVDMRLPEENIGGCSYLKFWDHELRNTGYVLNTIADEPHGAEITALVYHPSEQMVVTCSLDATFRVWVPSPISGIQGTPGKLTGWKCRSIGSYRHREMLAAAFSPDGSLLAVSAGELVTLWNPVTNGFISSLAFVSSPQNANLLAFVHNSKFLVAASCGPSRPCLTVWHLATLSVQWSCPVNVEALSVDPQGSHFGIIMMAPLVGKAKTQNVVSVNRKAIVVLFKPDNPTPTAIWSIQEGLGAALFFGSSELLSSSSGMEIDKSNFENIVPQSCMLVLTGSHEYVLLNPYAKENRDSIFPVAPALFEAPSAYLAMYAKSSTLRKKDREVQPGTQASRPWGDLLSGPSHVLPSLTQVGFAFLGSLLEKQSDIEKMVCLAKDP